MSLSKDVVVFCNSSKLLMLNSGNLGECKLALLSHNSHFEFDVSTQRILTI